MEYFSRSSVKQEAKDLIRPDKRWLNNFFAGIVPFIFTVVVNVNYKSNSEDSLDIAEDAVLNPSIIIALISASILSLVIYLVIIPICVSYKGSYQLRCVRNTEFNAGFVYEDAFSHYGKYLATGFMRWLYIFLWTFVLFIPNVILIISRIDCISAIILGSFAPCIPFYIKYYAYYLTYYIIGDNPNLTANEAITLSRKMTKGHKWDLFVLDLSFIGWGFLSILGLCIPFIWVLPYIETTKAMYYENYKKMAIDNHVIVPSELGIDYVDTDKTYNSTSNNISEPEDYIPGGFIQQNPNNTNQQNVDTNNVKQQNETPYKPYNNLNSEQQTNYHNNSDNQSNNHMDNLFEISDKFDFNNNNKSKDNKNKDDDSNSNGFEV